MSRRWWTGLALLGCAWAAIAAGGTAEVRKQVESTMLVTGSIDIDQAGNVTAVRVDKPDKLPEGVVKLVNNAVPAWKFEPVSVDGRAHPARAKMTLRMVAKKLEEDRYELAIRSASFGEDENEPDNEAVRKVKMTPPGYPLNAASAGVTGTVYLLLRVGVKGQVEDAIAEQTNLEVVGSENIMASWRKVLEQSSIVAARRWRFKPPTAGPGARKDFWVIRVPIDYRLYGLSRKAGYGTWESYVPGPHQFVPWVDRNTLLANGADAFTEGGVYQVGRGLKLLTPLDGS